MVSKNSERKCSRSESFSHDSNSSRRSSTSSASSFRFDADKVPHDGLVKIVTIGDSGVGKSSIIRRYVDDEFQMNWMPTIGVDVRIKSVPVNGNRFRVQVWDTAGQERFRSIAVAYFRGADGFVLVFDIGDRDTFIKLGYWIQQISERGRDNVPMILCGNKSDLQTRQVSTEEAEEFSTCWDLPYFETSARLDENIVEAFHEVVGRSVEHKMENGGFALKVPTTESKKGCRC